MKLNNDLISLRPDAVRAIQKILGFEDEFKKFDINAYDLNILYEKGLLDYFLDESQNSGPTIKEFIDFIKSKYPESITKYSFECYIVNTSRVDTRFTIEGISGDNLSLADMQYAIDNFSNADEFSCKLLTGTFRAWWD